MASDINQTALDVLRGRITKIIPAQIRACVEKLDDEQLWWRPNEEANSAGNLVLHLSGSIRHYVGHLLAGIEYRRDRAAEFAERGPIPKAQLLAQWDNTIKQVSEVLADFNPGRFLDRTAEPEYLPTVFELIYNTSIHMATHAGQIVWITKMLQQGSVNEVWINAHREARGAR
jgi:uncharacterized damage-inducible protein DinB